MKMLLFALCAFFAVAHAQTPPLAPKRPLGVPADAKAFGGRWYKVVLEKKSWHAARDKCREMGGQLVTVPDAATWDFVKTLSQASVWLGATDEATEGAWKWVDGSDVTFTAWLGAGADNRGNEDYLCTFRGGWNDARKDGAFDNVQVAGFIVEWGPKPRLADK